MSEYATPHNDTPTILRTQTYWRISAFALSAVALLGIVMSLATGGKFIPGFLTFDWGHNIVHIVLAGAAFVFGFAPVSAKLSRLFAIVFGFVYMGLGLVGFFIQDLALLHLELGENLVHIVLGVWALAAGFLDK